MSTTTYTPEIIARAEAMLRPVAAEMARMSKAEAQKHLDLVCQYLAGDESFEAQQVPLRIRAAAKARAEQAAIAQAQAEAARVEAMKAALLSDPFMVKLVHALAVELLHCDTTPETVRDVADELPRVFRKLRI